MGIIVALVTLPVPFIKGTGDFWRQPKYDLNQYLTTWNYFLQDQWRLPVLELPAMGYPEGGSVLETDALPVGQLTSKAIHSATGKAVNPFGWWIFLTYVLQGAMAARVVRAAGARSLLASVAAAVLAVTCVPFMTRLWHVAVSSHFLILWALALYLENVRDRRFSAGEHCALSALSLLVNAYLLVMAGVIQAVTFATLWKGHALARRDWTRVALALCGIAAVGIVEGYVRLFSSGASLQAFGFGHFSWNPITLVIPPERYWGYARGIVRDATGGQAEGESYIGLGSLLVLTTCLLARPRQAAMAVRRHWPLALTFLAFAAYAASDAVYLGARLLLHVPLPHVVVEAAGFFRASGRFIWVPAYALSLLPVAALFKWTPRWLATPVVLVAIVLQVVEARTTITDVRPELETRDAALIHTVELRSWMENHHRLFQFPSWSCEAVAQRSVESSYRELQVQLLAARLGLPTNSVYTSRQFKDCSAEAGWAFQPDLQEDVLYVLNKADVGRTTSLASLASSAACVDAGWGLVCSRGRLKPVPPPAIASLPNTHTPANAPITVMFAVAGGISAGVLTVSGRSSIQALVPDANLAFGGRGAGRTLTIAPAKNQEGATTITVTASDGSLIASTSFVLRVGRQVAGDLDGDRKTDVAVYRPSNGTWSILKSSTYFTLGDAYEWDAGADIPILGDFDGDGRSDLVVFRPSSGQWLIKTSSSNFTTELTYQWGITGDVPVPADYDGDSVTDIAIYRPSNRAWSILKSSTGFTGDDAHTWGAAADVAVPGDYDGDGRTDVAVYKPSSALWLILKSSINFTASSAYQWGAPNDLPVASDYDGDGKTDLAVYRPSNGTWHILRSSTNFTAGDGYVWGSAGDVPVPGDYDGDGRSDIAVYRPSSAHWFIPKSSTNYTTQITYHWGSPADIPLLKRP